MRTHALCLALLAACSSEAGSSRAIDSTLKHRSDATTPGQKSGAAPPRQSLFTMDSSYDRFTDSEPFVMFFAGTHATSNPEVFVSLSKVRCTADFDDEPEYDVYLMVVPKHFTAAEIELSRIVALPKTLRYARSIRGRNVNGDLGLPGLGDPVTTRDGRRWVEFKGGSLGLSELRETVLSNTPIDFQLDPSLEFSIPAASRDSLRMFIDSVRAHERTCSYSRR